MVQLTKKRKMTKSKISSKSKKKFNKSRKNGMKTNNLIGGSRWFREPQRPGVSPLPRNLEPKLQSGREFAAKKRNAVRAQISSMQGNAPHHRAAKLHRKATPAQLRPVIPQLPSSRR